MGIRNFLFTKRDGFDATGIMLEYAWKECSLRIYV